MLKYLFAVYLTTFAHLSLANTKVTFLVPDFEGPLFWQLVADTAGEAAKDLNIDFNIIYSRSSRFDLLKSINDIIKQKNKPDYIIFRPFTGNSRKIFSMLERAKIKFLTVENSINKEEYEELGAPNQHFKHWLGHISYDDVAGGKLLRNALISAHKKKYPGQKVVLTGIGGDHSELSINRQQALTSLINSEKIEQVTFTQIFPVLWNPQVVKQRYPLIMSRYPETNAFWVAGDQVALQLVTEQKQMKHKLAVIGGFDWLPGAIESIKRNELTASVGGHFLMVASAVIKIADYENGLNIFTSHQEPLHYELITIDNVNEYATFIEQKHWKHVDFRKFSKFYSKETAVTLSVENMLKLVTNTD